MASLAGMMEKYNLVGNKIPANSAVMLAAMTPFLQIARPVQSIEKVSGGVQTPLTSMRKVFQDITSVFVRINREHEKQSILLDRAEKNDDEERQERVKIIRQNAAVSVIEEESTTNTQSNVGISNIVNITRILSRLSGLTRALRNLSRLALTLLARGFVVIARYAIGALRTLKFLGRLVVPLIGRGPVGIAIRAGFGIAGIAGGIALERLLDNPDFENRAERLQSTLRQFGEETSRSEASNPTPGEPVRAEGGVTGGEAEAMNFFMSNGFTREQAAGIVGNLIQESNLNPRARPTNNENSQGIAQWNPAGGRQRNIEEYLGKPILEATFQEQLRAVLWELNGNGMDRGAAQAGIELRQATTADQAAEIFMRLYERPHRDHANLARRRNLARRLAAPQQTPQSGQAREGNLNNNQPNMSQQSQIPPQNMVAVDPMAAAGFTRLFSGSQSQNNQTIPHYLIQPVLMY